VALRNEETLLGVIMIYRQEVRLFSDRQVALLRSFAAQAVIAMENARLISEQREALEQQTATAEVLQVINSSPGNLAPVFDAMLDKAMRLCEAAFGGLVMFKGTATAGSRCVVFRQNWPTLWGGPSSYIPKARRIGCGAAKHIIHIADIATITPDVPSPGLIAMLELGNARTCLWGGLYKDGVALGYFVFYRTEVRPFSDRQIALVENFARRR